MVNNHDSFSSPKDREVGPRNQMAELDGLQMGVIRTTKVGWSSQLVSG